MQFPFRGGRVDALAGINLTVPVGSVYGFLGPNGAGKTTTLHLLLGFLKPTRGSLQILGGTATARKIRSRLGYLAESPDPYRFLTGREMMGMTGRLFGLKGRTLSDRIEHLLTEVGLADAADRRIAAYSRGMVQRLGIAEALIHDPDLVILDEPTSGMDPLGRLDVRRMIQTLREAGKTVFFCSHELSEVELVADTIAILRRGRIIAEGNARDLARDHGSLERYFIETVEKVP